jgi:hypothetical protein
LRETTVQTPYNAIDAARIRRILDLAEEHPANVTLNFYIDAGYVHVELRGHGLPADKLRELFSLSVEQLMVGDSKKE